MGGGLARLDGFGVIADLVHLPLGTKGIGDKLRDKAGQLYTIPGTDRTRVAGCELPLFENAAVEALFQGARGLPRQINRIAHYALSAAALDKARTVNADHLQHALDELRP